MKFLYLLCFVVMFISGCSSNENKKSQNEIAIDFIELNGKTQGTTYTIKYDGKATDSYQPTIDSILNNIDLALSLWVPRSELSKLNMDNTSQYELTDPDGYFLDVFKGSKEVYKKTNGFFDPSIDPIIEALGLGVKKQLTPDFEEIKLLRAACSFADEDVFIGEVSPDSSSYVVYKKNDTRLNFNAIAQGYAVDVICGLLKNKGHHNYYVEIGGELKVDGKSPSNKDWRIGIDRPQEGQRQIDHVSTVQNCAMATSGSYRKYIVKDGRKYSHTINPISGLPVDHNLLSVTVKMKSCMLADAYATAFMAMGLDKTLGFIEKNSSEHIEVFLIYQEENKLQTYSSHGFVVQKINEN